MNSICKSATEGGLELVEDDEATEPGPRIPESYEEVGNKKKKPEIVDHREERYTSDTQIALQFEKRGQATKKRPKVPSTHEPPLSLANEVESEDSARQLRSVLPLSSPQINRGQSPPSNPRSRQQAITNVPPPTTTPPSPSIEATPPSAPMLELVATLVVAEDPVTVTPAPVYFAAPIQVEDEAGWKKHKGLICGGLGLLFGLAGAVALGASLTSNKSTPSQSLALSLVPTPPPRSRSPQSSPSRAPNLRPTKSPETSPTTGNPTMRPTQYEDMLQIGSNWKIAQIKGDGRDGAWHHHLSISANNGNTAMIFRGHGTTHAGPRTDFNAWTGNPNKSDSPPKVGNKAVEIDQWRIRQHDSKHLTITHSSGNVAQIFRRDGTVHGSVQTFNGYSRALGEPVCAFLTEEYIQLGDWRLGRVDCCHFSVSHSGGYTARIYKIDGTVHTGRFGISYNAWNLPTGDVLQGNDEC